MSTRRSLGLATLATGAVGAAIGGVLTAERRAVGRARRRPDPYVDEPFGALHSDGIDVIANDGVSIHVEIDGAEDAPLTLVFCHGFTLSMDAFHFQRQELASTARMVFYDHRSHGRSGHADRESCTIDQLARDLYTVLQAVVPHGPVVLVGHSMGGMTILGLADQHPELFGDRVVGVGLLSTSSGQITKAMLGVPGWLAVVVDPAVPQIAKLVRHGATFLDRNRRRGTDFAFIATRFLSFGPDVPPSLVEFAERMILGTSIEVMSDFFDAFLSHDKLKALDVLRAVPVLISCGDRDVLTPLSHSEVMAAALPDAELQVLPGAGHMALIDRHIEVNRALVRLLDRVGQAARSRLVG